MTYPSALTSNKPALIDLTLLIDGIPILFGTRAGLVVQAADVFVGTDPTSLTSVDALVPGSASIEGAALDRQVLMVPPGGGAISIDSNAAWDKYFDRRTTPITMLTQDETAAATTFHVRSTSGLSSGMAVYCDRECCMIDDTPEPTIINGILRNYAALAGTKAAKHMAGAKVSVAPRSLLGRSAELRAWSTDTDNVLLRRLIISKVEWDGKTHEWNIAFNDAMAMFDRVIAKGFKALDVTGITPQGAYAQFTVVDGGDTSQMDLPVAGENGHILVANNDQGAVLPIRAVSTGYPRTDWVMNQFWNGDQGHREVNLGEAGISVRRVYEFTGNPMEAALKVLLSDKGDGDNDADWDVLYGRTSTSTASGGTYTSTDNDELRFGAAIPAALVDIATLEALAAEPGIGWHYVLGADGEERLLSLLEEVAWQLQGFWYLNDDGKLSFKRMSGVFATTTIVAAITEDHILKDSSLKAVDDETEVVTGVKFECNYDFALKKARGFVNIHYRDTEETYRDVGRVLTVKRKGLLIALPQEGGDFVASSPGVVGAGLFELERRMDRVFYRAQNGIRKYSLSLPWRFHTLQPGDVVTVQHEGLKTFDGSTMATAMTCEVTSQGSINFSTGRVEFEVSETWNGKLISPTSKISTWAGGTPNRANLAASSKYGDGATPQSYWAVGWKVYILDKSAAGGPFSTKSALLTITEIGATYIEVGTTVVGFTPAVNDIVIQANYDDADNATTNTANALAQRGYAFAGDANALLGTSDANADEWG
jgi:hypothetical protein